MCFKGKKLKAELDPNETRILNELLNPNKTTLISVGKGKEKFFINAENTKTRMKIVTPKGKKPYVDVQIKIQGSIEEAEQNLHHLKDIKEYEKRASILISSRIKEFLEHLQKLNVDPLGLGLKFQAKNGLDKNVSNAWSNIYPNLEFHVNSEIRLKGTGSMY